MGIQIGVFCILRSASDDTKLFCSRIRHGIAQKHALRCGAFANHKHLDQWYTADVPVSCFMSQILFYFVKLYFKSVLYWLAMAMVNVLSCC